MEYSAYMISQDLIKLATIFLPKVRRGVSTTL
jgi:hypothetical protein